MAAEEAATHYKGTEEPPKCVLIHLCTPRRQRCQSSLTIMPTDDSDLSLTTATCGFILSVIKELLVQIFVVQVDG